MRKRQRRHVRLRRRAGAKLRCDGAVGALSAIRSHYCLKRFPFILDHSVIQYEPEAPPILVLAHVLVGEPDSTSPGHALWPDRVG
jgi:hypothetical protein